MGDLRCTAPKSQTLTALLVSVCLSPAAMADSSPWYVGVVQGLVHESNLYRVDSSAVLGTLSRSDTISTTSLVAGIDQPLGRQRLYGRARLGKNSYRNNDYLNDNSYNLTAGLDWSSVERISGTLGIAASSNQRSFNVDTGPNTVETRKNNENIAQLDATVRIGVVTPLTLEVTLGYRRVGYSAPEYDSSEYRQNRASLGVRYRPGVATFGASLGLADTHYEQAATQAASGQAAERVRRSSLDLSVIWPASGHSNIYARLSPTRVTYDRFTQRDFSGLTSALKWEWLPTGKLNVEARLVHDISQDSNFETFGGPLVVGTSNTGRTTTELQLSVGYQLTAMFALNSALGTSHRSLERTANAQGLSVVTATGSDRTGSLSVGARWSPIRSLQVGCSVARDRRSASGGLTQDYRANNVSCSGQLTLQ